MDNTKQGQQGTNRLNNVDNKPVSTKTEAERSAELKAFMSSSGNAVNEKASMPDNVRELVSLVEGLPIKIGETSIVTVPELLKWDSYVSKNGRNKGDTIFSCLGRFEPITVGKKGIHRLIVTVSVAVLPEAR